MTAWTAKAVEYRVLDAAETLMLTPDTRVGGAGGGGWPEYIPHYPRAMKIRIRPSPGALTRMLATWAWINALQSEKDRRLLYAWAWTKTRKGRFLNDFASREGVNSRTLRWTITRICQDIADRNNQQKIAWLDQHIDDVAEIEPEPASQTVSSETSATIEKDGTPTYLAPGSSPAPSTPSSFIEPGARPRYPTREEIAALVRRLEKANKLRRRKAKAASVA
ncbi:hypothetical protein C8D77_101226 [Mesorhizobium loti]|uniref:Uncharacterized protein n=1 Tax=Rhizobium loti TaxID=381 RepID=A0A8E3B6Y0_RHILI|nr:hypothetical protein [Mesorhizobium loti]PWJ93547.1 hypothetical protein C8D77_101226 [Mesorhizobium loti]